MRVSPTTDEEEFLNNLAENMNFLSENLDELPERNQSFGLNLCTYYEMYDTLTVKQLHYAIKLWQRLNNMDDNRKGRGWR